MTFRHADKHRGWSTRRRRWTLAKIWMMSTFSIIWMVRGPRDENVLSTGFRNPFLPCNVNQRRRIPRRIYICPYSSYWQTHHDRHLTYLKLFIDLFSCVNVARTGFAAGVVYLSVSCKSLSLVHDWKRFKKTEIMPVPGVYTSCQYQEFDLELCQCRWWRCPGTRRWCTHWKYGLLFVPTWDEIEVSIVILILLVESIYTIRCLLSKVEIEEWWILGDWRVVRNTNQNWWSILVAEKNGKWKKLENLVQSWSIESIVGARPTATPRNKRRDHVEGIEEDTRECVLVGLSKEWWDSWDELVVRGLY